MASAPPDRDSDRSASSSPADDGEGSLPPSGRFDRFRRLAGLGAQLGVDALRGGARRLTGGEAELLSRGTAEKLVATLGDLKGAAMKLGQMAAMDPDLLGPEVRQVLARLQNQAPAMAYAQVARVVEEELGAPPERLFAHFERAPFAAASLGQVHRARLEDGREVAVKVQYPGVRQSLQGDLDNLGLVVKTVSLAGKGLDGSAYYREVCQELLLELDYRREAELARAFAASVERLPDLVVPGVVDARSAERVLTLELLPGPTLKDWVPTRPPAVERFRVSRQLVRAIYGPFFLEGLIHADPHPGNFLVLPDGRLGVLDFGSIKRFSPAFVQANRTLFLQALRFEARDALSLCRAVGFTVELPEAEAAAFLLEILDIAGRPWRTDAYDYARCEINADLRRHFTKNAAKALKVRPPPEAVLFLRATGGLGQNLRLIEAAGDFRRVFQEVADLL
ncbi:AarF/ABC1/UbiB kinase family protein [Aggregicoccus sp. 17bor-14]|uniref:ABC1 kinase family protein n=1 Tax=Myxococcaceae TaxID=31 RepID=UPI00129CCDFB|nr:MULTISPECIES: AarF/ABC1/UbiB kinase family protein [Myxococcaceae]MBF5043545.1 AarF/ABC1/UbiB kinase family protein [Simulacricoccus sp. 17bor-14]MRI89304.1 AarF/ABC1/UbiB kinase family protein [Aggregicoccus sp. 17bor-14]